MQALRYETPEFLEKEREEEDKEEENEEEENEDEEKKKKEKKGERRRGEGHRDGEEKKDLSLETTYSEGERRKSKCV